MRCAWNKKTIMVGELPTEFGVGSIVQDTVVWGCAADATERVEAVLPDGTVWFDASLCVQHSSSVDAYLSAEIQGGVTLRREPIQEEEICQ